MTSATYDAIVIGSRLAGATTALLLAQRGYSILLLDRDRFPSSTLSTHLFFTDTLSVFQRIGVLDEVLAIDAPRLKRLRFPYVDAPFPEVDGRDFALCIRRETLDIKLVEAASRQPEIELHTGARVTSLVWDDTGSERRVVGVRFQEGGEEHEARGRIVIGADGRHSLAAREVGAASYHDVPPMFAWYYGYFRGVPLDDPPSAFAARGDLPEVGADYAASFVFPCDDGLTLVGFGVQADAFDRFRRRHREHFFHGIARIPVVAERIGEAPLEGQTVGTGDLPNFLRAPAGPGWALAGDAGCHKDPHTIQGIGDAARGAVLLSDALDRCWRGETDEATALAAYHRARDADVSPMYDFTTGRLERQFSEDEWKAFGRRTWDDPAVAEARVAATAHAIPPANIYSAEAIRKIIR